MADDKDKKDEEGKRSPRATAEGQEAPTRPAKAAKDGEGQGGRGGRRTGGGRGGSPDGAEQPRLAEHYEKKVRPELMKRFGYANPMQAPRLEKIVVNMGVGDALHERRSCSTRPRRELATDHRPEAVDPAGEEVDRELQAARGRADRLHGDAARRADVRVLRPAGQRGDAAHPRLPRRCRPRSFDGRGQLHAGPDGADHLSGDQLRQGGEDPRHGRHDRDDGAQTDEEGRSCCG